MPLLSQTHSDAPPLAADAGKPSRHTPVKLTETQEGIPDPSPADNNAVTKQTTGSTSVNTVRTRSEA